MRRKWFPKVGIIIAVLLGNAAAAQQKYQINVKEAVDIAFKNVTEIKNARLDYEIIDARNKEVAGAALPQITGSFQANHYLSLPLIQFPDATELAIYDVLKREGVRDANGNPITADGQFNVRSVSFLSPWNINFGANVQQLLFEPQVFVGLQARKAFRESGQIQIKVAEDKVRETVYKSYYAVLIYEKQLGFVQESLIRLRKLSSDMEVMFKNGFVERLDIDKTTVSLNNTLAIENQLKNGIAISYASLKMVMGLNQADTLVLRDSLSPQEVKEGLLDEAFSYEDRNEIKLLNKAKQLQSYDIKRYKLSYFPTVAAFYNFQRTGQRNPSAKTDPWFWYSVSQIGVNLSLPIFDGNQKKYKIKQSKLVLQKLDNSIDQAKKGIDLERVVARNTLTNALLSMDIQEDNMRLAQKVFDTEKRKYEAGLGSSFNILQSDTDLQQAQANYFRALYEAIVAKVSWLKASGKL
jgi:outer membrane protein